MNWSKMIYKNNKRETKEIIEPKDDIVFQKI